MIGPADILRRSARLHRDRTAVWCDGRAQTYATLWERSCRLANALLGLGVRPGDRVALLGANGLETTEQIGGLAVGNFVRAGLYAHVDVSTKLYSLELVDARVLIVQGRYYDEIADRLGEVPTLEHVIVYDGEAPAGTLAYEELLAAAPAEDPALPIEPGDRHVIRFSAGTTGKPKGILHTVERWTAMSNEFALCVPRLDEDDCYLAAGPLTHAAGLFMWPLVHAGAETAVMPAFSPERALELIEERRVTFSILVATMIKMLANHPDAARRDLSSLRFVGYGSSPIAEQTLIEAIRVWGNIMYQVYGQSECMPGTVLGPLHHRPDGDERERGWLRSAGRPSPNAKITIVDDDGNELPTGEVGEIAIGSPGRLEEIWKDPATTAERLLPDGSFRSRDMGYLDEDGFLYLADRKEDMIISGGYNIWPAELENALASHPAVFEACVVGVPHDKWGETPMGAVVLRDGASATEEELIEWTREKVGSTKKVTSIQFVDALPKTPIGKVLRREVRERYWSGVSQVAGA